MAPGAVTDLVATTASPRTAVLRWTAPGDDGSEGTAHGYEVRRAAAPIDAASWLVAEIVSCTLAPRIAGSPETLRVVDLVPRSDVCFAIRSHDEAANESPISNTVALRLPAVPDTIPPHPVIDLAVTDSSETSVTLRWTAPADSFPEGAETTVTPASYEVRYAAGTFNWQTATPIPLIPAETAGRSVTRVLSELAAGTTYLVAVRVHDTAGNASESCAPVAARTMIVTPSPPPPPPPPTPPPPTPPPPPPPTPPEIDNIPPARAGEFTALSTGPTTLRLAWRAPGDDEATGRATRYQLRWSLAAITEDNWAAADSIAGLPSPAESGAWESFDWPGRAPRTVYFVALRALDESGNSSSLVTASATTPPSEDTAPPEPPSVPRVAWTGSAVALEWDGSPDPDVAGYRVERRRGDRLESQVAADQVPGLAWSDTSAAGGNLYAYSLRAIDGAGNASRATAEVLFLVPVVRELLGIFPNPSPGMLRLVYARETAGPTSLELFDATGRVVGLLAREADPAGRIVWEISDLAAAVGGDLASGVYYARLRLEHRELPARIVLHRGK